MKRLSKQIYLTWDQMKEIKPLVMSVQAGGAVVAQVYGDGMVVAVLTPEEAKALQDVLWKQDPENPLRNIAASSLSERNRKMSEVQS